ncbi:MAG: hypothetical protein V7647_2071 [Acidobacteriota bacterium]|jgi:hypothetical protein
MTFAHLNRRTHLYLGLALLPWFFMYAVSSIPFAHTQFFERRDAARGLPLWTLRSTHSIDLPVTGGQDELRALGAALLRRAGVSARSYGVYRQSPTQLNVYAYSFRHSTQLKYFIDQKRLTVEERRFRWDQFLTGMHARGGFEQESMLDRTWSVIVDLVCLAIVLWIASGFYMWWGLPGSRSWGWVTIAAGVLTFVLFTLSL